MKVRPKKAALIGLAATTLFGTAACGKNKVTDNTDNNQVTTEENQVEVIYGPPNMMTTEETTEATTEITTSSNEIEDVYGPPADMDD